MFDPVDQLPESDILTRSSSSLMYIGKSFKDREIWLNRDDMTRHMLVAGSTGSGKTEFLLGLTANSIASGNGVVFVDGKGDISTFAKIYSLAYQFNRVQDVLLVNFSQANKSNQSIFSKDQISNTLNPFDSLGADDIVQIITSLMIGDNNDQKSHDQMWTDRAIAMVTAVVYATVWLKEKNKTKLRILDLRENCNLKAIIKLSDPEKYPNMPDHIRDPLINYLNGLPGYIKSKTQQNSTTLDQHGYLQMQTTRLFSSLIDIYGHILNSDSSHVDMKDAVINRRIVVVLLPALEKSSQEIKNIGLIITALLKSMMSTSMATCVQGNWETVVENRPTNAQYPALIIMDEASHYINDGMALMAGQARSLGFCLVFAVQDIYTFESIAPREANAIIANTNTKILMNMQNPDQPTVLNMLPSNKSVDSYRTDKEHFIRTQINQVMFESTQSSLDRSEKEQIVKDLYQQLFDLYRKEPYWDLKLSLKSLKMGEFIVLRSGDFLKGRSLYVTPSLKKVDIKLNNFLNFKPDVDEIIAHYNQEEFETQIKKQKQELKESLLKNMDKNLFFNFEKLDFIPDPSFLVQNGLTSKMVNSNDSDQTNKKRSDTDLIKKSFYLISDHENIVNISQIKKDQSKVKIFNLESNL